MPPSAKLTVYSCAEATESWRKDQFGPGRAIIILKAFPERTKLIKQGSTSRHYKSVGVFIPPAKSRCSAPFI